MNIAKHSARGVTFVEMLMSLSVAMILATLVGSATLKGWTKAREKISGTFEPYYDALASEDLDGILEAQKKLQRDLSGQDAEYPRRRVARRKSAKPHDKKAANGRADQTIRSAGFKIPLLGHTPPQKKESAKTAATRVRSRAHKKPRNRRD